MYCGTFRVAVDFGIHVEISGGGDKDKPEIDRKDLRQLLLSSIPDSKVRWGCKIQNVQKESDGSVSVHGANGRVEPGFRLVVGADGAWSKVRKLVSLSCFFILKISWLIKVHRLLLLDHNIPGLNSILRSSGPAIQSTIQRRVWLKMAITLL